MYDAIDTARTSHYNPTCKGRRLKRFTSLLLLLTFVGFAMSGCEPPPAPLPEPTPHLAESEIISKQGIHWHTKLSITILGQKQDIPVNIGIGITEQPIHTHEEDNILHLEFTGLVKKDDIRLGRFFEIWDKKFSKDCIFSKCNGPEGKVKMFVNGESNFEFESYVIRDKGNIEIIFE